MLTISEAASVARVAKPTIYGWFREGLQKRGKPYRPRILMRDLREFLLQIA